MIQSEHTQSNYVHLIFQPPAIDGSWPTGENTIISKTVASITWMHSKSDWLWKIEVNAQQIISADNSLFSSL